MIELRHLRYFVAVAREGHITRAAEKLHIAQPPLSQQIKQLEAEIKAQLFLRLPRGVALTDAGHSFLVDAEAVLAAVDRAAARARRTAVVASSQALRLVSSSARDRLSVVGSGAPAS